MRKLAAVAGSLALLVLAGGCGDGGTKASDDASTTVSRPPAATSSPGAATPADSVKPLPRCGDVWRVGKRLPEGYAGCSRDGHKVAPHSHACSSGQRLDSYGRHYFAARGAPIRRVADLRHNATFQQALRACSG